MAKAQQAEKIVPINSRENKKLEKALRLSGEVLRVIPHVDLSVVRIIAQKTCAAEKGAPEGYESNLMMGFAHVQNVLNPAGFEIVWPPFGLVSSSRRGTTEIWVRYQLKECRCQNGRCSGEHKAPNNKGYAEEH